MQKQVMLSAWAIFRIKALSFSEAMKLAWKKCKAAALKARQITLKFIKSDGSEVERLATRQTMPARKTARKTNPMVLPYWCIVSGQVKCCRIDRLISWQ